MTNQPNKGTVKDGLPTAKEFLRESLGDRFFDNGVYVYTNRDFVLNATEEYAELHTQALRDRVRELEGLLTTWVKQNNYLRRYSISDFDDIHNQTKKALKK